jgi:hypothetical protein
MKAMFPQKRKNTKVEEFRSDSYEASLTPEERQSLYALLRAEVPYHEILKTTPVWRTGENMGQRPWTRTLYGIKHRLDLEDMLMNLEGESSFLEKTKSALDAFVKGSDGEKVLDRCMALIGQEVIQRTLKRLNPGARTAAAKLLLKRADQRRVDRRLDMVDALNKGEESEVDTSLTPEGREAAVKRILGIS